MELVYRGRDCGFSDSVYSAGGASNGAVVLMLCPTTGGDGHAKNVDTTTITLAEVPLEACEDWMEIRNIGSTNLTLAWGVESSFNVEPLSGTAYHAALYPGDSFSRENFKPGAVRCVSDAIGGKVVSKVEFRLGVTV